MKLIIPINGYHQKQGLTPTNKISIFQFVDINKMYTVNMPSLLSSETRGAVAALVTLETGIEISTEDSAPFSWAGVVADNTSGCPYQGTLLKRLMNYLWKENHIKLSQSTTGKIGNLVGKDSSKAGDNLFHFKFDPIANYTAGEFGDGESCFWQSRTGARMVIRNEGGCFIEFYDNPNASIDSGKVINGNGLARCFIVPVTQFLKYKDDTIPVSVPAFALCNVYSKGSLNKYNIVRAVSTVLGMTYKNIPVRSNITNFYTNDNYAYLLLQDVTEYDKLVYPLQFTYDVGYNHVADTELNVNKYAVKCVDCGGAFSVKDSEFSRKFRAKYGVCRNCLERNFSRCIVCKKTIRNSLMLPVEGHCNVCKECAEKEKYKYCSRCSYYYKEVFAATDGNDYCEYCLAYADMQKCSSCGLLEYKNQLYKGKCKSCFLRDNTNYRFFSCSYCGKYLPVLIEDAPTSTNKVLCPECSKRLAVCKGCGNIFEMNKEGSEKDYCYKCKSKKEKLVELQKLIVQLKSAESLEPELIFAPYFPSQTEYTDFVNSIMKEEIK